MKQFEITPTVATLMAELCNALRQQAADKGVRLSVVHMGTVFIPVGEDMTESKEIESAVIGTFGRDPRIMMSCAEMMRDGALASGYVSPLEKLVDTLEAALGLKPADGAKSVEGDKHVH